jgi:transglutaminase-like putative cysteine protease
MFDFLNNLTLSGISGKKYNLSWLDTPEQYGNIIKNMINEYKNNPEILQMAQEITANCLDDNCRIEKLYDWVKDNVTFQDDPALMERLIAPDLAIRTINQYGQIYEDCDSITALLGSLVASLGIPVKVAMSQTQGNNLSHVYLKVYINGQAIPLDATYKNNQIGWEYPSANKIEI